MFHPSNTWYGTLLENYRAQPDVSDGAVGPFCGAVEPTSKVEVALSLGAHWPSMAWMTHPSEGLLAKAEAVFQLRAGFMDERETADDDDSATPDESVPAGHTDVDVAVPLASMALLENTCGDGATNDWNPSVGCPNSTLSSPEARHRVVLFACVDLAAHVGDGAPSPVRSGFLRRLHTKGLRGVYLRDRADPQQRAFHVKDPQDPTKDVTVTFAHDAVMQDLPAGTNCFPGQAHGCDPAKGQAAAPVHAAGAFGSTEIQCTAGAWPGTTCTKMFVNTAPLRSLLFLDAAPHAEYDHTAQAWAPTGKLLSTDAQTGNRVHSTMVGYTRHGSTAGAYVRHASPCWPHAHCGLGQTQITTAHARSGGVPAWVYIGLSLAFMSLAVAVVATVLARRRIQRATDTLFLSDSRTPNL